MACGGDDCDDFDPNRFPGNAEVCDVDGHDEDCVASTVGDTDADMDGFISAACCNGGTCGDDCADTSSLVSPAGAELCNGRDDDCDGEVDEEDAGSLCPGGVCSAGRCDLAGWDRTFGGIGHLEFAAGVAMDGDGTIFAAGDIAGEAEFSGERVDAADSDVFVAAYEADGRIRWVRTFPSPGFDRLVALEFDAISSQLYGLVNQNNDRTPGGPEPVPVLLALGLDGEELWRRSLAGRNGAARTLAAHGGVSVGIVSSGAGTVAGSTVEAVGELDGYVLAYSSDGAHQWTRPIHGGDAGIVTIRAMVRAPSGGTLVAGASRGEGIDFGEGLLSNTARNDNLFVARLSETGGPQWVRFHDDAVPSEARAISLVGDEVVVAGNFGGAAANFFGTDLEFVGSPSNAVLTTFAYEGGAPRQVRGWAWNDDQATVVSLASTSAGEVIATGFFTAEVDFGGGRRPAPRTSAAFALVLDEELRLRAERVFAYPGWPSADCPAAFCEASILDVAVGPADSTALVGVFANSVDLGSGARVSRGRSDGFLVRLPN